MRRKTDKLVVACTALCILCAITIVVVSTTVLKNRATTQQIQNERRENIRRNCQDINVRHDRTIVQLDALLVERMKTTADRTLRAQIRQSRASTVLLLDAILPVRDCAALVASQVNTK